MPNLIDKILTPSHARKSRGYTLFELLAAGSLTSLVLSGAGFAWQNAITFNQKSAVQSNLAYNVNRAAEFIQEEIKSASKIESDALSAVASISGFTLPTGATPVLVLKTAEGDDIVYYTQPASSPWIGPNGIYRWGHSFDENGNYDTTQSPNSHILIDNIDDTPTSVTCPSGWQSSTTNASNGFYACIQGDNLAQFNINGVASPVTSGDSSYGVETTALARSGSIASNPSTPAFTINGNELVLSEDANITFEVIGGAAQCSSSSPQVPMDTDIEINANGVTQSYAMGNNSLSIPSLPAGATANVTTTAYWQCLSDAVVVNTATENVMVQALRNGDSVPDYTPAFETQSTIDGFLQGYIENGKIVLPENQVIYLFEMYTSNTGSSSFDMQDNVVLATVDNAN